MSGLDIFSGATSYRDQLDRTRRFLRRALDPASTRYISDFRDFVWAFFRNCWHIKDWVKHDALLQEGERWKPIVDAAHASEVLKLARGMCNGTKHLLDQDQVAASHAHVTIRTGGEGVQTECFIHVDGELRSFHELGPQCLAEWERILVQAGLSIEERGT